MSEILYNDLGPSGKPYIKGDWTTIALHDEQNIKAFFGDYRWLSNFYPCDIFGYPSVENAYMAAKVVNEHRAFFKTCSPAQAKKQWKTFPLLDKTAEEWDSRKLDVMTLLVFEKFRINKELRQKLLDTGNRYLEETNWWNDQYWGVDVKNGGRNELGKLLMKIRNFWKE